jgi:hypothetical protein
MLKPELPHSNVPPTGEVASASAAVQENDKSDRHERSIWIIHRL